MKEEILNQFLEKLLHYVNSAEIFANKNVPLYIEELLNYEYNIAVFYCIAITLTFIFGLVLFLLNKETEDDHQGILYAAGLSIAIASFIVGTLIVYPMNIKTMIKIKTAPRVFVVDYLRGKGCKR